MRFEAQAFEAAQSSRRDALEAARARSRPARPFVQGRSSERAEGMGTTDDIVRADRDPAAELEFRPHARRAARAQPRSPCRGAMASGSTWSCRGRWKSCAHRFSPFGQRSAPSLFELLEILDTARRDPQVDGVLLRIRGPLHGISRVLSLRRAVQAFREAGKPVAVYAETLEAESLLLASAAAAIWLPETGNVFLVGLRLESMFLRGVLERLDLETGGGPDRPLQECGRTAHPRHHVARKPRAARGSGR